MLQVLVFLAMFVAAWYLTIVRPQKQHKKLHEDVTSSLAPGDRILTVGGIYGTVLERTGDALVVELGPGTTTEISRSAVAGVQRGNGLPVRQVPIPEAPAAIHSDSSNHEAEQVHMQHQTPNSNPYGQPQGIAPDVHPAQPAHPAQAAGPNPFARPAFAPHAHATQAPVQAPQAPGQLPQQPYAQPYAYMNEQPPQPLQPPPAPAGPFGTSVAPHPNPFASNNDQHVYRAHVVDHAGPNPGGYALPPVPTFEPRIWTASPSSPAPVPAQQHMQYAPEAHYAPAVPQPPASLLSPITHATPTLVQPAVPYYAQPPQHHVVQPHPIQMAPPPPQQHQALQQHQVPQQQTAQQPIAETPGRHRSRAPQGMGQSDTVDPSLIREFERARQERSQLAGEYERLVAPMVSVSSTPALPVTAPAASMHHTQAPNYAQTPVAAPTQTQHLFVHQPGVPPAQVRSQFPGPAHTPAEEIAANPVPRPGVNRSSGADTVPAPFARSAPYAPQNHSEHHAPVAAG